MDLVEEEILSDVDLKEKEFHGMVREVVILCLISISLYIGSFAFLGLVRRERDEVRYNILINILFTGCQIIACDIELRWNEVNVNTCLLRNSCPTQTPPTSGCTRSPSGVAPSLSR